MDEVLEIQRRLLARFGGEEGVRDLGVLESALYRPQTGYYETLEEMAAALLESLLLNHAFVDGNKRIAFFVTDVFLRMNGFRLKVKAKEGNDFLLSYIQANPRDLSVLIDWVKAHLKH